MEANVEIGPLTFELTIGVVSEAVSKLVRQSVAEEPGVQSIVKRRGSIRTKTVFLVRLNERFSGTLVRTNVENRAKAVLAAAARTR